MELSRVGSRDEGVGGDEFVLRMADGEHGALRNSDDALGHAAHQQVRDGAAAACAGHDEIDVLSCPAYSAVSLKSVATRMFLIVTMTAFLAHPVAGFKAASCVGDDLSPGRMIR